MARGITESDVHTAADEIVVAGERPTVERIWAPVHQTRSRGGWTLGGEDWAIG